MGRTITAGIATVALALLAVAPAAAQASVSVSLNGGTLQVVGDATDNPIHWSHETDPACPGGSPCYAVWSDGSALAPSAPCIESDLQPGTGSYRTLCPASGVTGLVAFGQGGDDSLYGDAGVPAVIHGGAGNDDLSGTSLNDNLIGGAGNDDLRGYAGNDVLAGQGGNDGLDGMRGTDRCIGGRGRDTPRRCERVRSVP
jgi:Ca2+-binding RTX toxin-like protein